MESIFLVEMELKELKKKKERGGVLRAAFSRSRFCFCREKRIRRACFGEREVKER